MSLPELPWGRGAPAWDDEDLEEDLEPWEYRRQTPQMALYESKLREFNTLRQQRAEVDKELLQIHVKMQDAELANQQDRLAWLRDELIPSNQRKDARLAAQIKQVQKELEWMNEQA